MLTDGLISLPVSQESGGSFLEKMISFSNKTKRLTFDSSITPKATVPNCPTVKATSQQVSFMSTELSVSFNCLLLGWTDS